jgi:hypothetical protein
VARMVRKQIYIEESHDRLLKEKADMTGLTESELVRRAIVEVYDAGAAQREREASLARFNEAMDAISAEIAASGESLGRFDRSEGQDRFGRFR